MKKKVLFVCIHNSARSQMAEELLRKAAGEKFEVESAGLEPGTLNPVVVEILREEQIDIKAKKPRLVGNLLQEKKVFDFVITVCDEANAERCPVFPGPHTRLHWGFPDPSQFTGTYTEQLTKTRGIKEEIKQKISQWLESLVESPRT